MFFPNETNVLWGAFYRSASSAQLKTLPVLSSEIQRGPLDSLVSFVMLLEAVTYVATCASSGPLLLIAAEFIIIIFKNLFLTLKMIQCETNKYTLWAEGREIDC